MVLFLCLVSGGELYQRSFNEAYSLQISELAFFECTHEKLVLQQIEAPAIPWSCPLILFDQAMGLLGLPGVKALSCPPAAESYLLSLSGQNPTFAPYELLDYAAAD